MRGYTLKMVLLAALLPIVGSCSQRGLDFSLPALDGTIIKLSDFRGQWVLVNYWARWCAPCREEMPELSRIHDEMEKVTVLGLTFEDAEADEISKFMVDYPVSYPILLVDTSDPPADLGTPRGLPASYLIGPDGNLQRLFLGVVDLKTLRRTISQREVAD